MQQNTINAEDLRLLGVDTKSLLSQTSKKPPRHRPTKKFIKGPIPLAWLQVAASLPGKCLHVGLLLWKEVGCTGSWTVRFCASHGVEMGMKQRTTRRALHALKDAGLVEIHHRDGQCSDVTLLDVSSE